MVSVHVTTILCEPKYYFSHQLKYDDKTHTNLILSWFQYYSQEEIAIAIEKTEDSLIGENSIINRVNIVVFNFHIIIIIIWSSSSSSQ